jgi:hypothetical protein
MAFLREAPDLAAGSKFKSTLPLLSTWKLKKIGVKFGIFGIFGLLNILELNFWNDFKSHHCRSLTTAPTTITGPRLTCKIENFKTHLITSLE